MRTYILGVLLIILPMINLFAQHEERLIEIKVVNLSDTQNVSSIIDPQLYKLNQLFDGIIEFSFSDTFVDTSLIDKTIEEMRFDYLTNGPIHEYISTTHSNPGYITLFVANHSPLDSQRLLGFTPVMNSSFSLYQMNVPEFDVLFIASAKDKCSTLIHELGHFFGLTHIDNMSISMLIDWGITNIDMFNDNYMKGGCSNNRDSMSFTEIQLYTMVFNIFSYRNYLLQKNIR